MQIFSRHLACVRAGEAFPTSGIVWARFQSHGLTECPNLGLCRRRGWRDPMYECYRDPNGYTCLVLVNGREYQTDLAYESDVLAQENAAMRAFMVCRNFSVNGGMLARNGIVQGLPANESGRRKKGRHTSSSGQGHSHGHGHHGHSHGHGHSHRSRSGHHSSSSSTTSFDS
jgi:hypothetical protein